MWPLWWLCMSALHVTLIYTWQVHFEYTYIWYIYTSCTCGFKLLHISTIRIHNDIMLQTSHMSWTNSPWLSFSYCLSTELLFFFFPSMFHSGAHCILEGFTGSRESFLKPSSISRPQPVLIFLQIFPVIPYFCCAFLFHFQHPKSTWRWPNCWKLAYTTLKRK